MSVNIKVTGGLNIEWGQIDPKATGGLRVFKELPVYALDIMGWRTAFSARQDRAMTVRKGRSHWQMISSKPTETQISP